MRQRQTLQQLDRLQFDDSGIIRLRRPASSNVAELDSVLPELDSALPPAAELEGSDPEIGLGLTSHPVTPAWNKRPDPERSFQIAAEASKHEPSELGRSDHDLILADADAASGRTSQSVCPSTEKELDMLSGQGKILVQEMGQASSSRDDEQFSYNANISHWNRSNEAGMSSHYPTASQDTAHERPTICQFYDSRTPFDNRHGSNNVVVPFQTPDQANYSPFSELDHLIQISPPRRSRR
ncbi:MAG: hypothetical protein Q9182_003454 [Xanthomendoza sp. 2 TL-2023]